MKRRFILIVHFLILLFLLLVMSLCGYLLYKELQAPDVMDQYDYEEIQDTVKTDAELQGDSSEPVIQYDADTLLAMNQDFLGWIYIPDSYIDLPVVFGSDNDWYLDHSFTGEYSVFGCPFLDFTTPPASQNRVIHGHNMGSKRTEMFSRLLDYQDIEYAQKHKTLYFSEPDREGEVYEVFAVVNFNLSQLDECNYMQPSFESEEEFSDYISYLKNRSVYQTDYIPEGETLILSTCNRAYGEDNRLLICAGKLSESQRKAHEVNSMSFTVSFE